ncbi:hypothetical protein ACFQ1B_35255 [Streptomyces mexicanus]
MSTYWPWWAGAVGLALVTVNHTLITDRSFGVSSAWDRVLHWRRERRLERLDEEFTDEQALVDALTAATAEHFGSGTVTPTAPPAAPPTVTPTARPAAPQAAYGEPQPSAADADPGASESPVAPSLRPAPWSPRLPCWCRSSWAAGSPRSPPGGSTSAPTWARASGTWSPPTRSP